MVYMLRLLYHGSGLTLRISAIRVPGQALNSAFQPRGASPITGTLVPDLLFLLPVPGLSMLMLHFSDFPIILPLLQQENLSSTGSNIFLFL